jgi:signal peptidase II
MNIRYRIASYLLALVVLIDQLTKWWIIGEVMRQGAHVEPINVYLNLVLQRNKGVTFGAFNNNHKYMPFFLVAVAAVILIFLGRWLWRTTSSLVAFALGLIMGGAIGNVIDRLRLGGVVDFLDFHYQNYHWYAFNVADAAIVTGVTLLLLDSLVRGK